MAADVAAVKMRRHVVVYIHATWRTHICLGKCVRMYACICAHVSARVISEIKHPFRITLTHAYIIYASNHLISHHVGLSFCFHMRR